MGAREVSGAGAATVIDIDLDPNDLQQVAAVLRRYPDDELLALFAARDGGLRATVEQIFTGMQDAYRPERAEDVPLVIQYEVLTADETFVWTVAVTEADCRTREGGQTDPDIALHIGLIDLMRLCFGQLDGTDAFMSGQLDVEGDVLMATSMQHWFETAGL